MNKWRKENHEHTLEYRKKYLSNKKKTDSEFKLKNDIKKNFASSFKRCCKKKTETFFSYTGIKFEDYVTHFKNSDLWNDFCNRENIHIDHIIPCSAYDFSNSSEIIKCWQPENLRLISAKENVEKSNRIDFDLIEKHNIKHLLPENLII